MSTPDLPDAVDALILAAETETRAIADLRGRLEAADLRRRKLLTAIDAAIEALPEADRAPQARRMARLAEVMRPARGPRPDSRVAAILARLAELGHRGETGLKVSDMHNHLEKLGFSGLTRGYASNALARLAEQGYLVKTAHGRFRINAMHPELIAERFRLLDGEMARVKLRAREIEQAEARGRQEAWQVMRG
jgi:hypothetical protein